MKKFALVIIMVGLGHIGFVPSVARAQDKAPVESSSAAKVLELDDGTKISIEGSMVYVIAVDGTKTSLPDGDYKTSAGTSIVVKDGVLTQ